MNALFTVWWPQGKAVVPVYGVRQTEFLIYVDGGWGWAKQKHFIPNDCSGLDVDLHKLQVDHYTDQR